MPKAADELSLKKFDIIRVGIYKYIVYKLKKDEVELLPINNLLETDEPASVIPKMNVNYESLRNHQKVDNYELFYLLNQKNPLIKEVLEGFLKDEERKDRKN